MNNLPTDHRDFVSDPLLLASLLWPDAVFYREQEEITLSVRDNDETFVPAGNMLGKDWSAGRIIVMFFLTRHPCRILTTSAKDDHLSVLWGEIMEAVQTSRFPLDYRKGGPLVLNHHEIKKVVNGQKCPKSYLKGMVAAPDSMAAMGGHHVAHTGDGIPRTLFVCDEASSVNDEYWTVASPWMNRALVIGNTWPCENFFKHAVKGKPGTADRGGDIPRDPDDFSKGYHRKVIKITAEMSPNVRYARAQQAAGIEPDDSVVVPGVLPWGEYQKRRKLWDKVRQSVSLDAEFWEGADVKLFPLEWLLRAQRMAMLLRGAKRQAKCIGVDPAEGGDSTAMCAVDMLGIVELVSRKTPDTDVIVQETLAFMRKHGVDANNVLFDRGGGGKQHADRLRAMGHGVRTVAFGETLALEPKRGMTMVEDKIVNREDRYAYVNRRAQMYHEVRLLLDPTDSPEGFAIPGDLGELLRQMGPIPLTYDREGRVKLLPKNVNNPDKRDNDTELTLTKLLGCSPDELDSLALAVHGLLHKAPRVVAGAI